jgi:hypothetical protein
VELYILSVILTFVASVINFFSIGSYYFLWGLADHIQIGMMLAIVFVTPFIVASIITRIFSKCRLWCFFDLIIWANYVLLAFNESENDLLIGIYQIALLTIPFLQVWFAFKHQNYYLYRKNINEVHVYDKRKLKILNISILLILVGVTIFCGYQFFKDRANRILTMQKEYDQNQKNESGINTTIFISSVPPIVDVYMDNKFIGKTNTGLLPVLPGEHELKFIQNENEVIKKIQFEKGKNKPLYIKLNLNQQ